MRTKDGTATYMAVQLEENQAGERFISLISFHAILTDNFNTAEQFEAEKSWEDSLRNDTLPKVNDVLRRLILPLMF